MEVTNETDKTLVMPGLSLTPGATGTLDDSRYLSDETLREMVNALEENGSITVVDPPDGFPVPVGADVDAMPEYTGGAGGPMNLTDLSDVQGTSGPGKGPVGMQSGSSYMLRPIVTQTDLDAVLASVAKVEWNLLDLQNGFRSFEGQPDLDGILWAPARYRLTLNNVVHLEGHIVHDTLLTDEDAPLVIAQLPPECRPGLALWFDCPTHVQYLARVDVYADGTLVFKGVFQSEGDVQYISLSGISFSVGSEEEMAPVVAQAAMKEVFGSTPSEG